LNPTKPENRLQQNRKDQQKKNGQTGFSIYLQGFSSVKRKSVLNYGKTIIQYSLNFKNILYLFGKFFYHTFSFLVTMSEKKKKSILKRIFHNSRKGFRRFRYYFIFSEKFSYLF
jgi:hypothetical protein